MERIRRTINVTISAVCLAGGAAVCFGLIWTKPEPPKRSRFARVLEVAALAIEPIVEATPIVGHGTVRPKHQVKIVPQVNGKLLHVHDALAPGNVIPEGELLFEIDPTLYESRVRQAQAEANRLESALERANQEMAILDEQIENVRKMLAIDERDHSTSKQLFEVDRVGTRRDVDLLQQRVLKQKDSLIALEGKRSIIPHTKLETQAQLESARARLKQESFNLGNTKILCPFDARVELVTAYESQVVTAHFSIATLTDVSAFELSVGIDPRDLRWLDEAIRPEALDLDSQGPRPEVKVQWSLHGGEFSWRGHVTRFERIDEVTRTARLVVEVRDVDMVARVNVGSVMARPALAIGMHCRVELPAEELADALLVPRHAIYDNRWVYVFNPDPDGGDTRMGILERRSVPMLRSVGDSVLVDYRGRDGAEVCDLKGGERVVVSPLVKPVTGMKVRLRKEHVTLTDPLPAFDPVVGMQASGNRRTAVMLSQIGPIRGGG